MLEKQAILWILVFCVAVGSKAGGRNGARNVSDAGLINPTFENRFTTI
jgi:hypothetical protein